MDALPREALLLSQDHPSAPVAGLVPETAGPAILLVGPYPEDESVLLGGVQAVVFGLCTSLQSRADIARVDVVSLPLRKTIARGSRDLDKGQVIQLDAPLGRQMLTIRYLPALLRRFHGRPGLVVHAHGSGLFQLALTIACRVLGVPLVWTLHGITEIETWNRFRERPSLTGWLRWALYRTAERLQQRLASEIVVDTDYVRRFVGRRQRHVHVVPAGIWPDETGVVSGIARDPELVLSLGVIHPRKGHHHLLAAFARVVAERPACRLVIAGALADPAYHEVLQAQVARLGLHGHVRLACNLPRDEIVSLLASASLFALHSQEESQGIALCEAMAAGMPVVATRVGGIPDVVQHGRHGLLTAYKDIPSFADAVLRLLADDVLRTGMAMCARQEAGRFAWDAVTLSTLTVYSLAQRRRGALRGLVARAPARLSAWRSSRRPARPRRQG